MNTFMLNRNFRKLLSLGNYAVRVTFADAVLCAVCGALYGIVFGGFGAQARNELTLSGVFSIGGTCAMIGFAIGATVAALKEVSRVRKVCRRVSERSPRTAATFPVQRHLSEALMTGVIQNPLIVVSGKVQPRITALGG